MDANGDRSGSVQYNRWNEDNINMNVEGSTTTRLYDRMCSGNTGVIVKTTGVLAALVSVYIIGYITGYYIHKC
ncbi:small integral membrane protein 1 [Corythoichthys intestinalis]|uniref:small integral membrane protein 1 n=1 Tax=Corythoichthys intestinalis TaxID=161448 RepID=UPI0025A5610D|nr:small integral membrane protein 1 [Corythoichthys intestinalis]